MSLRSAILAPPLHRPPPVDTSGLGRVHPLLRRVSPRFLAESPIAPSETGARASEAQRKVCDTVLDHTAYAETDISTTARSAEIPGSGIRTLVDLQDEPIRKS